MRPGHTALYRGEMTRHSETRRSLAQRIRLLAPTPGEHITVIPRLSLYHRTASTPCFRASYEPGLSIFVQGRKRILLGGMEYLCDSPPACREGYIPFLGPLAHREILYRILRTPQAERLRAIATSGDLGQRMARAISWLRENYAKPLRMENLASTARMASRPCIISSAR